MKIFHTIFRILALTVCAGCGNSFLDISPTTQLGDFDVVQNEQDLNYALNGAYTYIEHYRGTTMWDGDVLGDDMMSAPGKTGMDRAYQYRNTKNSTPTGRWDNLYGAAFDINSILEKAKNIKNPTQRYHEMIAELRFIRVILHWDAELRFGPLPSTLGKGNIKTDALGVMITDKIPENLRHTFYRDKVTDVWHFMITEMEELVNDLPKKKREAYLNYWAGKTFMARLYLYHEDYEKAFECAKEVIEKGPYTLYEITEYVEAWGKTYTSESIFEMPTTDSDNLSWNSLSYNASRNGYATVVATSDFLQLKEADPEDVRFNVLAYNANNGLYYPEFKYPGRDGNVKVCNPKILRLSECYLIAAEAALKNGDAGKGGKYLSDLREKRTSTNPRKYDGGMTLDDVLYERRLELWGEGHRAFDLWRNLRPVVRFTTVEEKDAKGHWCNNDAGTIPFDDHRTIWPIAIEQLDMMSPEDQITQQNPGY